MATNISAYMAQNQPKFAIKYAIVACSIGVFLGFLLIILVNNNSMEISRILIQEKMAQKLLSTILKKFSFLIPLEILTAFLLGVVRSIGKTKLAILFIIVSCYVVYFSVYFYM